MSRGWIRLSGGRYGGRRLAVPPRARPTEARVREALFSIWGPRLGGASFLDLYAGSGAVGLEALGRGVGALVMIEEDPRTFRVLESNVGRLECEAECRLIRGRLPSALSGLKVEQFDLVFADPPYAIESFDRLIDEAGALVAPGGVMAVEHTTRRSLEGLGPLPSVDVRRYGESVLTFFSRLRSG